MKIFSGSSNPNLTKKIATQAGLKLGKIELSLFPNTEIKVFIKEKLTNQTVVIVQSLSHPCERNLVELCLIADAAKRLGAKEIISVIPWLAYSKQDKVFRPGEPLSAKVIAKMIQSSPINSVITFDLHNIAIAGFFDIPVVHLTALPLLEQHLKKEVTSQSLVVSVGAGGSKLSSGLAQDLNVPLAYFDSKRDLKNGRITVKAVSQKIQGKDLLIIDDMIATGSTLLEVASFLKKNQARSLTMAVTHHLFIKAASEKLEKSPLDKLYVTDSIPKPPGLKLKKTQIISLAPQVATYLKENF